VKAFEQSIGGASREVPAVLLGGEVIAVSAARSLGKAGIPVYALGDAAWDTVGHSRYCTSFIDLGSGAGVQERWLEWLTSGPRGAVVLPCNDDGLEFVARNRAALIELGYITIEANDQVLLAMLDKQETYALGQRIGIPVPRTIVLRGPEDLDAVRAQIGFPCAVKPRHSHLFARHFGTGQKLFVAHTCADLERICASLAKLDLELIGTELIPGSDDQFRSYYSYIAANGEPLFDFTKRKLRQYPARFGRGSYHMTDWDSEVANVGRHFLVEAGVRGLACVEFKRDERDSQLKLIECNHRFTAATELARLAGIDLVMMTYNRLTGDPHRRIDGYRVGVRLWHPVEDFYAFRSYQRRGELTLGGWVKSLLHRQHFATFSWKDPAPSISGFSQKLGRRLRRTWEPTRFPRR
jgi:D-aspartate ligase